MKKQIAKPKDDTLTLSTFLNVITDLKQTLVSKTDLKEALRDYPTKEDLKEALEDYPTKEEVKLIVRGELTRCATKKDVVDLGESLLQAIEETEVTLKKNIVSHEKRITALETAKN